MLVGVIQEPSVKALAECLENLPEAIDAIELRLDACRDIHAGALDGLVFPKPVIVSLRAKDQGGEYQGSEASRLELLLHFARSNPDFIDMEYSVDSLWADRVKTLSPRTQLILSYHNFKKTPDELDHILAEMKSKVPGAIYKIATMANSILDTLRMLVFCKQNQTDQLIGICMGEHAETTQILAPVVHMGICYCPVTALSAPGQIDATILQDVYHFKKLNKATQIHGLIGNPVQKSKGHLFHNGLNYEEGLNAVYVKWAVLPEELEEAIGLLKKLDVFGLSVTMPLKEHAMRYMDDLDIAVREIGALNTVGVQNNRWIGYNTYAAGARLALPHGLEGKKVIVIGAGGAAKAIIYELKKYTSALVVLARNVEKAAALGVPVLPLESLTNLASEEYDCLINTLPTHVELPFSKNSFHQRAVVMDITYTDESPCLNKAKEHGALCVDGIEMFHEQASLQRTLWNSRHNQALEQQDGSKMRKQNELHVA